MPLSHCIQKAITKSLTEKYDMAAAHIGFVPVEGGSINKTYQVLAGKQSFFCKINSATKFPHLFTKEAAGLATIAASGCFKTPLVIDHFVHDDQQILLMEWIQPTTPTLQFWSRFGAQLACMHKHSSAQFGATTDNYMGSVAQSNKPSDNWIHFFQHQRLVPLVKKCFDASLLDKHHIVLFENLYSNLPGIFAPEPPSLLHGDLWSGNFLCTTDEPVLIDPAVYYGHRSVDLGMTTLFGGFHKDFYDSYNDHFPLPENYPQQWDVCNLYPLLIHLLLFGSTYLRRVIYTVQQFQ